MPYGCSGWNDCHCRCCSVTGTRHKVNAVGRNLHSMDVVESGLMQCWAAMGWAELSVAAPIPELFKGIMQYLRYNISIGGEMENGIIWYGFIYTHDMSCRCHALHLHLTQNLVWKRHVKYLFLFLHLFLPLDSTLDGKESREKEIEGGEKEEKQKKGKESPKDNQMIIV